tara:strand:+ start:357 stop:464 length:108 start_codon:yes stop_codon:yes gene_type:complete
MHTNTVEDVEETISLVVEVIYSTTEVEKVNTNLVL